MSWLPAGWTTATLGDITDAKIAQTGPSTEPFTYVDIGSINVDAKKLATPKHVAFKQAPSRAKQNIEVGDVLVSLTRPNLNAVALVTAEFAGAVASTGFHGLRPIEISPLYLHFFAQTRTFIDALLSRIQGVVYPAVRPKDVSQIKIPIPPLAEQNRIVAEIEKQFTRLDAALLDLHSANTKSKAYKTALVSTMTGLRGPFQSDSLPKITPSWSWRTILITSKELRRVGASNARSGLHEMVKQGSLR